ncbi:MAG: hypothetical protein IJ155_00645 [Prevotella sp.]|nr:hypothetical protein [Prevotella sp.]
MEFSSVRNLFSYTNGESITPNMGVQIDAGYGLSQFWDVSKGRVTNTDFTQHPATLFPQAWSSRRGRFIVPDSGGWYYGSPSGSALTFDAAGNCTTTGLQSIFKQKTVVMNGLTFPALEIKGNLASASMLIDRYIYYKGTYQGMDFTCQQVVTIQVSSADSYDILLSVQGEDGSGDDVLSNDNDWVKLIPSLQRAGTPITSGVSYVWQRLVSGSWQNITSTNGVYEINATDNSLKVYNAAVEGVELFRVAATCEGKTYYKVREISDVHDPYYIIDGCSCTDSVQPDETATFRPKVIDRASNSQDTTHTWTFAYTATKLPSGDVVKTGTGATFSLTYDEIEAAGGNIMVRTQATAS